LFEYVAVSIQAAVIGTTFFRMVCRPRVNDKTFFAYMAYEA
jgi:hypothetical protein